MTAAFAPASTAPKIAPVAAPEIAPPATSAKISTAFAANPLEEPLDFDEPPDFDDPFDFDELPDLEEPLDLEELKDFDEPLLLLDLLLPPDLLLPLPDFDKLALELLDFEAVDLLPDEPLLAPPEGVFAFTVKVKDLLAPLLEADLPAEPDFAADAFAAPPFVDAPDLTAAPDFAAELLPAFDEPDLLEADLLDEPDLLEPDLLAEPDDFEPEFFDAGIFFLLVDLDLKSLKVFCNKPSCNRV